MNEYAHNVVQVIVYRWAPKLEYLILKRSPEDGGWWQPITGHIEPGETEMDALRRELDEEVGISKTKYVSGQIYTYDYEMPDGKGRDMVYMVEVAADQAITLSAEHVQYEWATLEAALERLKYAGNKESLRRADLLLAEAQ